MNVLPLASEATIPTTLSASVVLIASLLVVVGWLVYLYR